MKNNGHLVSTDDLDRVLQPLHHATNLPAALYTEEAVAELERRCIWSRMWTCVGRAEDLADTGDFHVTRVAGNSVLLCRGADTTLRAFHNVCRHRGACLVDTTRGHGARAFRCNYHGWSCGTDGGLIAAPLMEERPGFDPLAHGLTPVRVAIWGGFVFVNLEADAEPLAQWMADFPDLGRYGLEELRRGARLEYEIEANWKVVCENYSECYHCALVHPQLNRVTHHRSGGHSFSGNCFNGGPMRLNEGMTAMSMSGSTHLERLPGLETEDRRLVHYFHLYPHFLLGLCPHYATLHRVWPLAPGRSRIVCDLLFSASAAADPAFDPSDILEFWETTNRQDWQLCEMVQTGAASVGARPGPYHPAEACVHAFDRWLVTTLGDELRAL